MAIKVTFKQYLLPLTANEISENEHMFLNCDFQAFLPESINIIKLDSIMQQWVWDKTRK